MPWSNQGGGPWGSGPKGPWGSGPQSGGSTPPDLEDLLRRSQDKLKNLLPGGSMGGRGFLLLGMAAVALWFFSGFFRVDSQELGAVMRFGKFVRTATPGLNYHLPYPIESVRNAPALRVIKTDIGMRIVDDVRRGPTTRDVPEETLMLTGDENIVDVDFAVLWKVKPDGFGDFLFNIQAPEGTVKAVAESAMREVVGKSEIEPILTANRQSLQQDVRELMQTTLDAYGAGIRVTRVQMQKADPPAQVLSAYRDVQAARTDQDRMRNEALAYANRALPEARGGAARIVQQAEGYKQQVIAVTEGEAQRFIAIHDQYKRSPEVTRRRIYIDTMQSILAGVDKVIIDTKGGPGVVPYLPLPQLRSGPSNAAPAIADNRKGR